MISGLLIYTNTGVKLICRKKDGKFWTPDECFNYCNYSSDEFLNKVRANRLALKSAMYNPNFTVDREWFKDRRNFQKANVKISS